MNFVLELAKLIKINPKLCLPTDKCENSPYNSFLFSSKDCHLCFSSSFLESCLYVDTGSHNKDCVDCAYINKCELCYECTDVTYSYNCDFCKDCKNCVDCAHCFECQGCTNCFGCIGLRKKEYHIFNKRYTKEEYFKKSAELKKLPVPEILARRETERARFPHPPMHILNSENCIGDYILNSKNCFMAFNAEKSQDCAYVYDEILQLKDCVDCTHIQDSEFCYNLMSAYDCYNVDSSWWAVGSRDCEYGFCILQCANCFGCVNLKYKKYHILNKPYSKEEYDKKVREIKDVLRKNNQHGKYLLMDAVELVKTL